MQRGSRLGDWHLQLVWLVLSVYVASPTSLACRCSSKSAASLLALTLLTSDLSSVYIPGPLYSVRYAWQLYVVMVTSACII